MNNALINDDDDDVAWYVCADREVSAQYTYE